MTVKKAAKVRPKLRVGKYDKNRWICELPDGHKITHFSLSPTWFAFNIEADE